MDKISGWGKRAKRLKRIDGANEANGDKGGNGTIGLNGKWASDLSDPLCLKTH